MGIKKTATAVMVVAGATAMVGAGVAHAVIPDPTPASYQLCGTVYKGAPLADNHPAPNSGIPDTAVRVQGVNVRGDLFGSTTASYSAVSGANGQFCLTGNAGMVATILGGGYVKLSTPGVTPVAISHTAGIYSADFANHQVGLFSATGFNIVVP